MKQQNDAKNNKLKNYKKFISFDRKKINFGPERERKT